MLAASRTAGEWETFVDILRWRADREADRMAYRFLAGDEQEICWTYGDLGRRARAVATCLQEAGAQGERALLLYPPGLEFVAAFLGCLSAGVVAVPAYPPRQNRPDSRIEHISADSQASLVLTDTATHERCRGSLDAASGPRWIASDAVPADQADTWRRPTIGPESLAVLQYTSGSTVVPKGVMVSHGNLMHHAAEASVLPHHGPESVVVSWLPHFHDMGLVYGILQPLHVGIPGVLMAPAAFLQRPRRWLEAISRHRGTHSGGPNFAFELCVRSVDDAARAGLDLSCWEVAFNGAEPVRAETLERFARAFEASGFRRSALRPTYGLAEATLKVTVTPARPEPSVCAAEKVPLMRNQVVEAAAGETGAQRIVSCGVTGAATTVRIIDPDTLCPCPPAAIGEIWIAGPSVAQGYWNRSDESQTTFQAYTADGQGPFMRTGDLGFLKDNELYVTGRLKDVIIIRGLNHYPQDIELTAQSAHAALRRGCGAAFPVDVDGEERFVVVHEVERTWRNPDVGEIAAAVAQAVVEHHEIQPHAVVLIRHGTILKTSSGKIRRGACRKRFLEGALETRGEWRPSVTATKTCEERLATDAVSGAGPPEGTSIEDWLVARVAAHAGIDPGAVNRSQPFTQLGIDSAKTLILVGELEQWLGRTLSPVLFWNYATIALLAAHLSENRGPFDPATGAERESTEA